MSRVTTEAAMTFSKHSPPASPSPSTPRSMVSPMAPTQPMSRSLSPIRMPVHNSGSTSELVPTEWKPKLPLRPSRHPTASEAFRYLSLYQKPEPPRIGTDNSSNATDHKPVHEHSNHLNNNK
ncbi:hypothetical protein ACJ72_08618, partial [Emergomyces africanus]